jgi:hypothetical protein
VELRKDVVECNGKSEVQAVNGQRVFHATPSMHHIGGEFAKYDVSRRVLTAIAANYTPHAIPCTESNNDIERSSRPDSQFPRSASPKPGRIFAVWVD